MSRVYPGTNTPGVEYVLQPRGRGTLKNLLRSCHLRFASEPSRGDRPMERILRWAAYRDLAFLPADSRVDKPLTADKTFTLRAPSIDRDEDLHSSRATVEVNPCLVELVDMDP